MIYFMDEGKKRKKYEIVVDKNGLEKLKVEIINNCSMIIHHDCNTVNGNMELDKNVNLGIGQF